MRDVRDDARARPGRRAGSSSIPRLAAPASTVRGRTSFGAATVLFVVGAGLGVVLGLSIAAVSIVAVAALLLVAAVGHRTVGSAVAGVALLLARPYSPGEHVRLYAPELHAAVEAEVVRVGLVHTTLATPGGLLAVPNSRLLRPGPED